MVKRSYRSDYTQCSFSPSLTYNRARAMYHIRRGLVSVAVLVLTCFGLIAELDALRCRSGMQNSVGYIYSSKPCKAGETACFQSVKCTKIGDTDYTDYKWTCIDGNQCSNSTGKYIARYNGIKGTCCFTSNCNAYRGPCTDAGIGLTAKWASIAFATVLAYLFILF